MSNLNIHSNHPLIPFPETKNTENHFVSISSQDRNLKKSPNSNDFVITLPEDYKNVTSVKLASSYFPIVDDQFSEEQNNVDLCFRFKKAFNPLDVSGCTFDDANIFAFVTENILNSNYFRIRIRDGRYNETQLVTEIQNKMNQVLTDRMAERIYGTSRYQIWGDYVFDKEYSTNLVATVDGGAYQTSDWASVYYNSSLFSSMSEAVTAFNEKHGTNIPQWNIETYPTGIMLNYTLQDINNFNKTATALDPAILCAWQLDLPTVLMNYLQFDNDNGVFKLYINGSSDGFLLGMEAKEHFLLETDGYDYFKLIIDSVTSKINFGNIADEFEIITDKTTYYSIEVLNIINKISIDSATTYKDILTTDQFMPRKTGECRDISYYIDDLKWGLPVYLGLTGTEVIEEYPYDNEKFRSVKGLTFPTYYYYNKNSSQYQPYQRKPNGYSQASIFIVVPTFQLDTKGEPYFFIDLDRLNCIDEIAPYKDNTFSSVYNISSGNPTSAFAKLPLSILDDVAYGGSQPMSKVYTPPLDRLSKISIRLRFHNGRPVKFGVQPFSFVLQITTSKLALTK
jgi:hypothetical protein